MGAGLSLGEFLEGDAPKPALAPGSEELVGEKRVL